MKNLLLILTFCLPTLPVVSAEPSTLQKSVDALIARSVPLVTTAELAVMMPQTAPPIILDSREKKEFEVSHLPTAQWIGYEDFDLSRVASINRDKPVIVYCSVGYRSEKIGEQLLRAGFKNVMNLYGGIFAWANEKRALVDTAKHPVTRVHGYDKHWAKLLDPHVNAVQPQN
jgi:rhodanese-related sulfurtransferase